MKDNMNNNKINKNNKFILDIQFLIKNLYLIITTAILYFLNLTMTYNGLVVYESLILYGKNLKEPTSIDFYSNIILAIFIITIPATLFSVFLNLLTKHTNIESKIQKITLKVLILFFLLWSIAAQIPSTVYSFESFFKKFYGSLIQILKEEIYEEVQEKNDLVKKDKENLLIYQENLASKIKKNKLMIENTKNRQVKLDPTFIDLKNKLQKEIEKMEEKNRALLIELNNSNNEIAKLNNKLSNFVQAKKEQTIRTQGVNVLFKNSSIIDAKNNIETLRTWFFLLLASTLDLLIGALLTFIYDARKKYIREHVESESKSITTNKANNNAKFDFKQKSNFFNSVSNFGKKITTQTKSDITNLGKELFNALNFVLNYLENDQATINSVNKICKKSGRTKYFVTKNINFLIKSNLIFIKNKKHIFDKDKLLELIEIMKENNDDSFRILLDKYKFTTI
ncbi:hypothetical protein BLA32_05550 (plasmid) [Borreliella afzelii]|uniref:Uncharacterized protein n=2 Tax=Borreliella afzelii TaxID=29518 RepID=A0A1L4DGN4_BORAF|nr:hypothetical protein BLA32_05550 [Borreliella afzelii]